MTRKKGVAAIARNLVPPPELPPGITLQSRSRSSKASAASFLWMCNPQRCERPLGSGPRPL